MGQPAPLVWEVWNGKFWTMLRFNYFRESASRVRVQLRADDRACFHQARAAAAIIQRASRRLHAQLLTRLLHAPLSFYDSTTTGAVLLSCGSNARVSPSPQSVWFLGDPLPAPCRCSTGASPTR